MQAVAERMRTAAAPNAVPYTVVGAVAGDTSRTTKSLAHMFGGLHDAPSGGSTRVVGGGTAQVCFKTFFSDKLTRLCSC